MTSKNYRALLLHFCIMTYAIIYVSIHHIIFWLYLYFLNILYFLENSCTNILHRRSPCTFYYIKLCASSQTPWWIKTWVTVRKRSMWVKIVKFLSRVTLKFDGWLWKTRGHLFYVASHSVRHFKAIVESKPNLQSGNAQFGSKLAIFCPVWPWNSMDDLEKQ